MKLFSSVTAEDLRAVVHSATGADPLDPFGYVHRGSPNRVDRNGDTKRLVYRRADAGDLMLFKRWADIFNGNAVWLDYMVSTRTSIQKKEDTKRRPIDIPSEMKRAYALVTRQILMDELKEQQRTNGLSEAIIGFRSVGDFAEYRSRKDKLTIQDVYAMRVYRLAKGQPFVVSLDQEDAFGNLPHRGIKTALKALGVSTQDARRLVELVRIRTWHQGRLLRPQSKGVEQGNPLAPLIFNLVHAYIADRLSEEGIRSAFYGDDIVLFADCHAGAIEAFDTYGQISQDLGFTNIRAIGHGKKATKVYDTSLEPVPLLKTFLVSRAGIELNKVKSETLLNGVKRPLSLNKLRKVCPYKSVSKSFLKKLQGGQQSLDVSDTYDIEPRVITPALTAKGNKPEHLSSLGIGDEGGLVNTFPQDDMKVSVEDVPSMDAEMSLSGSLYEDTYQVDSDWVSFSHVFTVPTTSGSQIQGGHQNGRHGNPRDHAELGVPPKNGGDAVEHHRTLPTSVKPTREHLSQFSQGKIPLLGDAYRPDGQAGEPVLIDLRGLSEAIPQRKYQTLAVMRLCRAASVRGKVRVLVHPSDSFVHDSRLLGGHADPRFRCVRKRTNFDVGGVVYDLRRKVSKQRKVSKLGPPPDVKVCVRSVRSTLNMRQKIVRLMSAGERHKKTVQVSTLNPDIAYLITVASALKGNQTDSVTFPARGMASLLVHEKSIRPRSVALHDALRGLSAWQWQRQGDWLLGQPKQV